ncbi:MAG: fibronectin type III domain-containing protein [Acidobacteriota bacterium]
MSSKPWIPALALGALLTGLTGCGKQGDPLPPLRTIPAAASDLAVQQRGGQLLLSFAYPNRTTAGMALPGIERVEIWQVERPAILPPPPAPVEPPADDASEAADAPEAGGEDTTAPEAAEEGPQDESEAAPTGPPVYRLPKVDNREFAAAATLRLELSGDALRQAIDGSQITVALPWAPQELPEEGEPPLAVLFSARTATAEGEVSADSNRGGLIPRLPPPAPVTELSAEAEADGIALAWEAADDPDAKGFNVYRRDASNPRLGSPLGVVGNQQRAYKDLSAEYGRRYVYSVSRVAGRRPLIESTIGSAREVDYQDRFAPTDPGGLVALSEGGQIRLLWNTVTADDLAGYRVYRRTAGAAAWTALSDAALTATKLVDRGLTLGDVLEYRVTAVDERGNESAGEQVITATVR